VLVAAVAATYSTMQFGTTEDQPQILSAIDETNLGLKEILGFTVGYYGSVLKVTGNNTYAQQLATNYLNSGLQNMGDVHPEWNANFNLTSLTLKASWFSNQSYSAGSMNVSYDLAGLGIYGLSYSTTTRLDVQILGAVSANQTQLVILRDENEPLINLGKSNLKFYQYDYQSSTWNQAEPINIASYANGTYILDLPAGVQSNAYVVEVSDTRGLMVLASSFTQFTSAVTWNSTVFRMEPHYVKTNHDVVGTHGNFTAQQSGPDNINDTLTEGLSGTFNVVNYPNDWSPLGSTTLLTGSLANLQADDGSCMQLRSYPIAYNSSYNSITFDSQNSVTSTSGTSMSWTHTTGLGSDRILLVSVDIPSSTTIPSGGVTYDGTPLTQLATDTYNNPRVRSYLFYLLNPSVGTKTIVVSFGGVSTSAVGGSVTYANVNQTASTITSATATGSSQNPSVSLAASGANSKVLFGHVGTYKTGSGYTITDSQTNRWNQTSQLYKGFGSEKMVTNGTVSTSWTTSATVSWVAICALLQPTQMGTAYNCSAEYRGTSNTDNWNSLTWTINAAATTSGVNATYQLYNYRTAQYVTVGNGYLNDTLGAVDSTKSQTITSNLTDFRDASGNWKLLVTANQTAAPQFDLKLDLISYTVNENNYALDLEEQWLTVNTSIARQDLCIKTGAFGAEPLNVQVLHGGSWINLMTLKPNFFNNISVTPYTDSSMMTIRFVGGNDLTDPTPTSWNIDCVYLKDEPDINYLVHRQQSTFTIELLQNGTMLWLGQNMQVTTQTIAVPPIPVKAIHVNETINGVNQEVPFQIEDWASNYQIPLGLTSNTTVFSNRQMIVFLLNSAVTDFTVWWDGSDSATQTAMAYTNQFFKTDNPNAGTITNGNLTLQFSTSGTVKATVAGTGTYSTATFMQINTQASSYDGNGSFVIHHGIVRDIVQEEAQFSGGITNCPNVYANIIITLPANATYYTYEARLMFIATTRTRSISNLCPIQLAPYPTSMQTQTENGTLAGFPLVQNGTGTFYNSTLSGGGAHHFTQFIQDTTGKGSGLMFTDLQNKRLYAFDLIAGQPTGALNANPATPLIQLLPVTLASASFTYAYDITWVGAVATFDGTTPVCNFYDGTTPMGLWILAEYPPTLTVTAKA